MRKWKYFEWTKLSEFFFVVVIGCASLARCGDIPPQTTCLTDFSVNIQTGNWSSVYVNGYENDETCSTTGSALGFNLLRSCNKYVEIEQVSATIQIVAKNSEGRNQTFSLQCRLTNQVNWLTAFLSPSPDVGVPWTNLKVGDKTRIRINVTTERLGSGAFSVEGCEFYEQPPRVAGSNYMTIIDTKGCKPTSGYSPFINKSNPIGILYQGSSAVTDEFLMFKFASSEFVFIRCSIVVCTSAADNGCRRTSCSTSSVRRRRRSIEIRSVSSVVVVDGSKVSVADRINIISETKSTVAPPTEATDDCDWLCIFLIVLVVVLIIVNIVIAVVVIRKFIKEKKENKIIDQSADNDCVETGSDKAILTDNTILGANIDEVNHLSGDTKNPADEENLSGADNAEAADQSDVADKILPTDKLCLKTELRERPRSKYLKSRASAYESRTKARGCPYDENCNIGGCPYDESYEAAKRLYDHVPRSSRRDSGLPSTSGETSKESSWPPMTGNQSRRSDSPAMRDDVQETSENSNQTRIRVFNEKY